MVGRPGLLRSGSSHLVRYAVRQYARKRHANAQTVDNAQEFADALCWGTDAHSMSGDMLHVPDAQARKHSITIEYLGIWDTVQATGFGGFGQTHWPGTDELWNVRHLRHAMSIDEWRPLYKPVPVTMRDDDSFEQAWFAGVHSDVGGTFENCELATVALKWVVDPVIASGELLLRDGDPVTAYNRWCRVDPSYATGRINTMSSVWRLAGAPVQRQVPEEAVLHETVRIRRQEYPDYAPHLPDFDRPGRFTDPDWTEPAVP
jgi:uncharacterized protein (DUF2235 family)